MPAHIKTTLTGASLTLPISAHTLALGTWQVSHFHIFCVRDSSLKGIWLCEHRNSGGSRTIIATLMGI